MTLPSTTELLSQQQANYQTVIEACNAVSKCVGVTLWDFTDEVSIGIRKMGGILYSLCLFSSHGKIVKLLERRKDSHIKKDPKQLSWNGGSLSLGSKFNT